DPPAGHLYEGVRDRLERLGGLRRLFSARRHRRRQRNRGHELGRHARRARERRGRRRPGQGNPHQGGAEGVELAGPGRTVARLTSICLYSLVGNGALQLSARGHRGKERRGMKQTPRRLIGTLIAAAALLVALPASAQALTVSGLAAAPTSTQAGAHSNFHIHMDFSGGQVKDLTVGLPPGQIGNPNATPLCTVSQLNADACDPMTKVGSVIANATVTVVAIPVTINVSGDLYNL